MVQKIVQDAANKVSKTVSTEIEEVHGGYWEKRYDIAKTLLTLNTSILVLQVTFYKEIITFFNSVNATYIIIASWVTIFLSLICTIACIKSSLGISAHKLRLFYALQFSSEEAFSANLTGKELAEDLAKKPMRP